MLPLYRPAGGCVRNRQRSCHAGTNHVGRGSRVPGGPPRRRPSRARTAEILFDELPRRRPSGHLDDEPQGARCGEPDRRLAGGDGRASWRPDGRKIVFVSDRATPGNPTPPGSRGPDFEIFVMNADGSHPTQLTFNAYDDDGVTWSPDGRSLIVQRDLDPVRGQQRRRPLRDEGRRPHERNLTNSPGVDEFRPRLVARRRPDRVRERPRRRLRDLHDEAGRFARAPAHGQHDD